MLLLVLLLLLLPITCRLAEFCCCCWWCSSVGCRVEAEVALSECPSMTDDSNPLGIIPVALLVVVVSWCVGKWDGSAAAAAAMSSFNVPLT